MYVNFLDDLPKTASHEKLDRIYLSEIIQGVLLKGEVMTLNDVKVGETCIVERLNDKGEIRRRIMDMGITKGAQISVDKIAPLGDPIDITLRGYHLSLRRSDAANIEVVPA